jgi:hypothetical protein
MCLFTKIYLIIIYIALNVSYEQKLYIYIVRKIYDINCFGLCSNTYFVSYIYDCLLGPAK